MQGVTQHKPGCAFLVPWSPDRGGGVTHVVVALLNECAAEGAYRPIVLEVNWAFRRPENDQWRGIPRVRLRLGSPCSSRRLRAPLSFLILFPAELRRLRRLISAHGLGAINMHFAGLESFSFVALRRLGLFRGKYVLTFHGSDVRQVLRTRGAQRALWRLMLHGVDLLVFVSEDLKEEFLAFDPSLASRCVVIHNGIDIQAFTRNCQEDLPLPEFFAGSHDTLISVGQFEYRKGHDLLIQAFELVLRERSHARLAIVGRSGPTLEGTRKLIAERGLETHIALFTDLPHSHVPVLLNRADVFVLSSRWRKGEFGEGFPLVLAEAGALARPVVSTQSTGCGEIISDRVTGRLVPLEDPPALADAILDLLNDRVSAQRMGLNLQRIVREQFSWQQAWAKYRQLLDA